MKTLINGIKNIFATILSLLSFGLIKLNKETRKEFRVQLMKVKLNECNANLKTNWDKLVGIAQEKSVHKNKMDKLAKEREKLTKDLQKAREKSDTVKFNELAMSYKAKDSLFKEQEKVVLAYEEAEKTINENIKLLTQDVNKLKYEIDIIEAKQKTYESMKEINNTMADIHLPNGSDNTTAITEIKEELDDDLVRETTKSQLIRKEIPIIETTDFNSVEEMDEFLKNIEVK